MAQELKNYRIHFVANTVDGEGDFQDVAAEDLRPIYNDTAWEFLRTDVQDGVEVEVTVRIVPLTWVTGLQILQAQVMEPIAAPNLTAGPALAPMAEVPRMWTPQDVAAGAGHLGTPLPPPGGGVDWGS